MAVVSLPGAGEFFQRGLLAGAKLKQTQEQLELQQKRNTLLAEQIGFEERRLQLAESTAQSAASLRESQQELAKLKTENLIEETKFNREVMRPLEMQIKSAEAALKKAEAEGLSDKAAKARFDLAKSKSEFLTKQLEGVARFDPTPDDPFSEDDAKVVVQSLLDTQQAKDMGIKTTGPNDPNFMFWVNQLRGAAAKLDEEHNLELMKAEGLNRWRDIQAALDLAGLGFDQQAAEHREDELSARIAQNQQQALMNQANSAASRELLSGLGANLEAINNQIQFIDVQLMKEETKEDENEVLIESLMENRARLRKEREQIEDQLKELVPKVDAEPKPKQKQKQKQKQKPIVLPANFDISNLPLVDSSEAYDALPSGTIYRNINNEMFKKP